VFQNQWKKRRAYYKKSDYSIKTISSIEYNTMMDTDKWKVVYDPSKKKPKKGEKEAEDDDKPMCLLDV
jgi:hypothetical protein